jgi:hypothetical protein
MERKSRNGEEEEERWGGGGMERKSRMEGRKRNDGEEEKGCRNKRGIGKERAGREE